MARARMPFEVRKNSTIEMGIKVREESNSSTYVEYSPGNGTKYRFLLQDLGNYGSELRSHVGLGSTGKGWLVTLLGSSPWATMVLSEDTDLIHWNHLVRAQLHLLVADAVVLAEVLGHLLGKPYVSSEEFLASLEPESCERDL